MTDTGYAPFVPPRVLAEMVAAEAGPRQRPHPDPRIERELVKWDRLDPGGAN